MLLLYEIVGVNHTVYEILTKPPEEGNLGKSVEKLIALSGLKQNNGEDISGLIKFNLYKDSFHGDCTFPGKTCLDLSFVKKCKRKC